MNKRKLQLQQLNKKLMSYSIPREVTIPSAGWINAIRITLGISLEQLGKKLSITKQSMKEIEQRETEGSITLNRLKEVAKALEMEFIYGFVPKDGSLEAMLERKSREAATKIVMRTSQSMKLEDQEISKKGIEEAIREMADEFKNELSKIIWD
jgi:predicted DNA-binding mobile mystery protein A